MDKVELLAQLLRFERRHRTGFTKDECKMLAEDWIDRFAHIDLDICRKEISIEVEAQYPSISAVHTRCVEAQRERNLTKRKPAERPQPPDPTQSQICARACLLQLREGLSWEDAKRRAKRELEREGESPQEREAQAARAREVGHGDGSDVDDEHGIPF